MSGQPLGVTRATRTDPVRVLEEMKRLAVEQLGALPGALYRPVEQALQSPSAGAESFHDQAALLVLRQHSASHVMRFRQQIAEGFDEFSGSRARNGGAALGLIDEHLIDFHLAGQRLAEILDQRYQQPLEVMKGRLDALAAALRLEPARNPIAPARLAVAFIETFGDAGLPDALGALLFRHYQQELARTLDDLYVRVNALLAAAGYVDDAASHRAAPMPMPSRSPSFLDEQVPPRFPQGSSTASLASAGAAAMPGPAASGATASGAAAGAIAPSHAPLPAVSPQVSAELSGLRAQLHAWRDDTRRGDAGLIGHTPPHRLPPRRELRMQEVITIVSLLQAEPPDVYARALAVPGRLADAIRDNLSEGARRLGLSPDQTRFSVDEEDAIDLVAMLFESLFRTHALQDRARRLYARLVLPYVKVALSNDAMFVQPGHPARRLLDAITEACEDNSASTPQDRDLLERAAAVSQRVVAEYNEDLAVFELAHAELEELLVQQRRRIELQETRAAKATYGRERLTEARSQADTVVQRRLAAPPLTQAVADFLVTPWRHHLVQTVLREGAESTRLADAIQLGNALVEADRLAEAGRGRELADRLLGLQPAIVQCLASSGLEEGAARHGMALLVRALATPDTARWLHPVPPSNAFEEPADEDSRLWLAGGTDTVAHDAGVAALMRRLKPGEWLRLTDAQGETIAVKVAWVSPLTSRLLLVNRRGLRVLVAAAEELAVLVSAGRLMAGAERTPFDEAMRLLKHRLDQAVGQR